MDSLGTSFAVPRSFKLFAVLPMPAVRMSFIQLDSVTVCALAALCNCLPNGMTASDAMRNPACHPAVWEKIFCIRNIIMPLRKPAGTTFDYLLSTNGVEAHCFFAVALPNLPPPPFVFGKTGLFSEATILDNDPNLIHSDAARTANFVGVDPGVRSVIAMTSLTDPEVTLTYSQEQWAQESGMRYMAKERKSRPRPSQVVLTAAPSAKCLLGNLAYEYRTALASIWDRQWTEVSRRLYRKQAFWSGNRRRQAMDKLSLRVRTTFGKGTCTLSLLLANKLYPSCE